MSKNKHGGHRPGAGRPKGPPTKIITFRIQIPWEKRIKEVVKKEVNNLKNNMKTGIELIAQERQEQIEKHGFTIQHDSSHDDNGLTDAALYLIMLYSHYESDGYFPNSWDDERKEKFLKKSPKEKLIIAGALIAAEIDQIPNP